MKRRWNPKCTQLNAWLFTKCPVTLMSAAFIFELNGKQHQEGTSVTPTNLLSIMSVSIYKRCVHRLPWPDFSYWGSPISTTLYNRYQGCLRKIVDSQNQCWNMHNQDFCSQSKDRLFAIFRAFRPSNALRSDCSLLNYRVHGVDNLNQCEVKTGIQKKCEESKVLNWQKRFMILTFWPIEGQIFW